MWRPGGCELLQGQCAESGTTTPNTALNVLNERDAFQQGLVGMQDRTEMSSNEVFVSKGRSQYLDSLLRSGRPDPLHTGAWLPAASAICWSTSHARGLHSTP